MTDLTSVSVSRLDVLLRILLGASLACLTLTLSSFSLPLSLRFHLPCFIFLSLSLLPCTYCSPHLILVPSPPNPPPPPRRRLRRPLPWQRLQLPPDVRRLRERCAKTKRELALRLSGRDVTQIRQSYDTKVPLLRAEPHLNQNLNLNLNRTQTRT